MWENPNWNQVIGITTLVNCTGALASILIQLWEYDQMWIRLELLLLSLSLCLAMIVLENAFKLIN